MVKPVPHKNFDGGSSPSLHTILIRIYSEMKRVSLFGIDNKAFYMTYPLVIHFNFGWSDSEYIKISRMNGYKIRILSGINDLTGKHK